MNISNMIRSHFVRSERTQLTFNNLRPNQIVQGQIIKLFPNNQALIQIGQDRKMAQLDTALSVGERYHFQVVDNTKFIHLKVLGESLQNNQPSLNIDALLQQLGLSSHRPLRNFVQHLMKEQIPFDHRTLVQSLPFLTNNNEQQMTYQILQRMIVNNLPLTQNIFQAHQSLMTTNLTNAIKQIADQPINTQLNQSTTGQQLFTAIEDLTQSRPQEQFVRAMIQNTLEQPTVRQLFSGLNFLSPSINFDNQSIYSLVSNHEQVFTIEPKILREFVQSIVSKEGLLTQSSTNILQTWEQSLQQSIQEQQPLTPQQFVRFQEEVMSLVRLIMPDESSTSNINIINYPEQLQAVLNMLYSLQETTTYEQLNTLQTTNFAAKSEFLQQIHHSLTHLGLNYEQLILEGEINNHQQTLKQTLLQVIQQQLPIDQERVQQLVHFINGLQLQSVEETNHFIYGNLVLPGEKLQLNSDLYMQFQSKKTDEGQVDVNHCRILYFLELATLEHTIVDMNVQDRIVSLTVYNDHQFLKSLVKPLETSLKKRLNEMDYRLSSVVYKPLEDETEIISTKTTQQFAKKNYSGVDFRI